MPNTFERLASTVVGSATTTVTFNNINQNYTDLVIHATIYSGTATSPTISGYVNSPVSYYATSQFGANGSTVSGNGQASNGLLTFMRLIGGSGAATNNPTFLEINLLGYSSAVQERGKCVISRSAADTGVEFNFNAIPKEGAIDSFSLTSGTNYFAANSTISIYGIRRA